MEPLLPIFSVSEISYFIKDSLEAALSKVKIIGEVSNFTYHAPSGHCYFSLKDGDCLIKAVCFKQFAQKVDFKIENGLKITVTGKISTFVKSSNYQIIVSDIEKSGAGELAKIFEELKQKLQKEGLFDDKCKKQLPFLPRSIGVITAEGGAVLHDILTTLDARFPTKILLYRSIMQGVKAAKSVISGVKYFNNKKNVDVIIIARGGGSFEDLFEFNNEQLVREVFKSKIPVISAIGHETDFTLLDFVADKRAPTPTGSIMLAVPSKTELEWKLKNLYSSILQLANKEIKQNFQILQNSSIQFKNAKFIIDAKINNLKQKFETAKRHAIKEVDRSLQKIDKVMNQISLFDVENILNQGFGVITKKDKKITSIKNLQNGDIIKIIMQDGETKAIITEDNLF